MKNAIERTLEFLSWRKTAYGLAFPNRRENVVLRDLARFCHINEDCPHDDPVRIAEWHAKQSVFRRIQRHLYLTPEELFAIYSGVRMQTKEN